MPILILCLDKLNTLIPFFVNFLLESVFVFNYFSSSEEKIF